MVATFFLQRTTAFILLIIPLLQISCSRKTKEKQYAKYDLNKRIAARLIWQLVIHSCVIFAYIISRRDGENNRFLAGVSLPPSSRAPRAQNPVSLPFQTPAKHARWFFTQSSYCLPNKKINAFLQPFFSKMWFRRDNELEVFGCTFCTLTLTLVRNFMFATENIWKLSHPSRLSVSY